MVKMKYYDMKGTSNVSQTYSELSGDVKENALRSFIGFYVNQYEAGSLEILSSKVSNEVMSSINEILNQNNFMGHGELVNESLRLCKPYYEAILNKLTDTEFDDDGEPVVAWPDAWEDQEEQLPTED